MREDQRPQPVSPYGVSKLAAEHLCYLYCVAHRVPAVSLRYFMVYGPRQWPDMAFNRFLHAMLGGGAITLYGTGEQTRDFTFVDDAVSATVAAADRGEPGHVYNIGGGARVTVNRVLELMAVCTGTRPGSSVTRSRRATCATRTPTPRQPAGFGVRANHAARRRNRGRVSVDLRRGDRDMTYVRHEPVRRRPPRWWRLGLTGWLLAATTVACGGGFERPELPSGEIEADRLVFERGTAALEEGHWREARTYFVTIRDNYPQSQYRAEARLSIGDTYEGEGTTEAYVQALAEYEDFLSLYPIHPRAAYAQYKVGLVHFHQMRRAERDQTETRNAVQEFETFITLYPDHELMQEARQRLREARDRLSEHDFIVGHYYYRIKNIDGAISRFRQILNDDPAYTRRDEIYFYLAEALVRRNQTVEAIPYFARLLDEFDASEYAEQARTRIVELETGDER